MIDLLIYIAVVIIIFALIYWLLNHPALPLPDPLRQVLNIVLVVIAVLIVAGILLSLTGYGPSLRLPR